MNHGWRPYRIGLVVLALTASTTAALPAQTILYRSDAFVVTDASVQQGRFGAVALSRDTLVSTYPRAGREVHFKFGLNRQNNEFPPGTEHTLYVRPRDGSVVMPVLTFAEEQPPTLRTAEQSGASEEGLARVTFRLDLRPVLRALARDGVYDPPAGPPIRAEEFEGVYVFGNAEPLTWEDPGPDRRLSDPDGDSIYTVTVPIEAVYTRPLAADRRAIWARRMEVAGFPQLRSPERLVDALYRLSLEELQQLVREGGALSAGAKWPGVWTRDVSYASVLSLALVMPDAVRRSLMAKVDSAGRIIQDTGTGGSWPVSTDRMTWALAAWELYAVTGDPEWLRTAYDIIRRSAEADLQTAFDERTGLFRGESSFLDWREQSHPRWMDPKDIYRSQALGTNVVHYATYRILGDMAGALGEPAARWLRIADAVRQGINTHLWQEDRGYYAQLRYGRNHMGVSPRSEALGEALAILYGVSPVERSRTLARRVPVVAFGAPSIWPYIPGIPPYHNAAIWPFVNAYWAWAAAEAGNTAGVEHGLASILRPAALFLTNKENMVAETGHFEGTELNSDRQLWSVAGNLAATYRILFGMRFRPDRLVFAPMVPPAFAGERRLTGVRYRDATLDVTVRGHGDAPARVLLDGRVVERAEVPADLQGAHALVIEMNGLWPAASINVVQNLHTPETPHAALRGDTLVWEPVPGAAKYLVHRNGALLGETAETRIVLAAERGLSEYQVTAVDPAGLESFRSEPVRVVPPSGSWIVQPPPRGLETEHQGYTGEGYLPLTRQRNTTVEIPIQVPAAGAYSIDVRYANGSGPINSGNSVAVRTLHVGEQRGTLVMPHRGTGWWDEWGYSSPVQVRLEPGAHVLRIVFTPADETMNPTTNDALLDHVRVSRLAEDPTR